MHHKDKVSSATEDGTILIREPVAAKKLGVSTRTLWNLRDGNAIPFRKIGRRVLYDVRELEAWVALGCPTTTGSAAHVRKAVSDAR